MTTKTYLPLGIESFREMRTENYYYVDKTGLIRDLLENPAKVKLFTRPRRFGKTLNMSMLRYFFEIGSDEALFQGLEISKEKEFCEAYQGKFPVISISLKGATGRTIEEAVGMLRYIIEEEAMRFSFLARSGHLDEKERQQYQKLIALGDGGLDDMSEDFLKNSLRTLSNLLQKHYGRRTVILIDEYDVPLDMAYRSGYYDACVEWIRSLFGQALKTNESLEFAVLTGCLRISKESIFTGLNNFKVYTVNDVIYNEYFGFTDKEVRDMLAFYGFIDQYSAVKEWYDGYRFGNLEIYCPWDVINYCGDLRSGNTDKPQNYWVNTSSNDIIRRLIGRADATTMAEVELLIDGGSVTKEVRQELTYRDLDSEIENIWSLLLTTGYLTECGREEDGGTKLRIPNGEIRWIFMQQFRRWFKEETRRDTGLLERFCLAFQENNPAAVEQCFTTYLKKTISIRDTNVRKEKKENFYHGILLGILVNWAGWRIKSNQESGEGYSDILIETNDDIGIVIEVKYAENARFEKACQEAMQQIKDRGYEEALLDDGMQTIYCYGIACYKKRCKVISG